MGLKYYLNLIKNDRDIVAVKWKYFINIFLGLSAFVLIGLYFMLRDTNAIMSGVFGMAAMIVMILCNISIRKFQKFLLGIINNDTLDSSDEIDAAFAAYRKGYADSVNKPINKIFNICGIVHAAIVIATIQLCIVLNLTDNLDLAERVYNFVFIILTIYIFAEVGFGAVTGVAKGIWYQNYTRELDIIKRYKTAKQPSGRVVKQKYKITEDKKPKEQIKYHFIDQALYKRFAKYKKLSEIAAAFLGAFFVFIPMQLTAMLETAKVDDKTKNLITGIVFGCVIGLLVVAVVILNYKANKTMKIQYEILRKNEAENALRIKLHELRTPFYRRWNIIMLCVTVGAFISNIVLSSIVVSATKNDNYGFIFFFLLWIEIITMFVMFTKALGRVRFKMIPLEDEIDRIEGRRVDLQIRIS